MKAILALLSVVACSNRVPPHLAIDPPQSTSQTTTITTLDSAIDAFVKKDPLARAPTLPDPQELDEVDRGQALAAFVRRLRTIEADQAQVERELQQLEDEWAGTAVVALSRGYRLRVVENLVATTPLPDEATEARVAVLITPLQGAAEQDTLPRAPLAWLEGDGALAERIRRTGDRWVLAGWLDAPGIPLAPVGRSLNSPVYDGLVQTPVGALVSARARGATADVGTAMDDLAEATRLALIRAAADRDKEQAAWSELRREASARVGADEPVDALLLRAAASFTPNAGNDRDAGAALLALAALRWTDACSDPPCVGVDRVAWMRTAESWHADVAPLAATWRVIALKEALDAMDAGHDTVLFPRAMVALADALLGTGGGPIDASLLRLRSPTPQVWLELARSVGVEGVTDWPEARNALGAHLEAQTRHALALQPPPAMTEPLERIAARAVP